MRAFLARRWFAITFAVCLAAVLLPLCQSRVLPFQDYSGIVGLGGALAHADDPAARVREFYDVDITPTPCALYFGWAWLAGKAGVPVEVAFDLFIALFAIAGPPLALLLLLRAFGRPQELALLAFPVSYHHQIWFGFLGSSASITGFLLALAFAKRIADRPRWPEHLGLAAAVLYVALGHPFALAFTLAAVAPLLVWPPPASAAAGRERWLRAAGIVALRLACFVPTVLFLRAWARSFFVAGGARGESLLSRISREVRVSPFAPIDDAIGFLRWLGNGYTTRWDEVVPAIALASVAAFLAWGVRAPAPASAAGDERAPRVSWALLREHGWIWLAWAALVLALGYLLLPMKLMWPDYWWGVRVRCVAPLFLVLVALPRPRPRGLPLAALAPAAATALVFAGYLTYDFRVNFRQGELDGFDEVVAALPPGRTVMAFAMADPHHTEIHPYLGQHYVARKGGRVVPYLRGHPGSYWVTMHEPPPAPPWSDPRLFVWEEHAGYEYFLLAQPPDGPLVDPFAQAPPGAVGEVLAKGRWRLYKNLQR
jgi:hypothetical protein